jgi:hypothetical protein
MMAMEYMAMRWYQHNLHGAYPTLSLKYKLPTMAVEVMAHMAQIPYSRTVASQVLAHVVRTASDTNVRSPPASATNARMALNVWTASEFMGSILTPSVLFHGGSGRIIA